MKVIEKTFHSKIKETSLGIVIILTLIALVPIGGSAFAQSGDLYCPPGQECFCTPETGVWHVLPKPDGSGGLNINAGCDESNN
jgi:hypothetical protein